jgi:glutathione S-transferase
MKLYYAANTRAHRPRWLLEELGVPYELVRLDVKNKENRQDAYLAVNPLGHVPAFSDGDLTMIESGAICLHLADKFPEKKMAPPPGSPQRAQYYQWVVFALTSLEPQVSLFDAHTKRLPEADRDPKSAERAKLRFAELCGVVDKAVAGREYLVGDHFTVADLLVSAVLGWGRFIGILPELPGLVEYSKRIASRPAAKRARAD